MIVVSSVWNLDRLDLKPHVPKDTLIRRAQWNAWIIAVVVGTVCRYAMPF